MYIYIYELPTLPNNKSTLLSTFDSPQSFISTVFMPSAGRDPLVQSLDDDIAAVREAVLKELEVGKDIMVVSHSWGSLPVSSALAGMGKKERLMAIRVESSRSHTLQHSWLQRAQAFWIC